MSKYTLLILGKENYVSVYQSQIGFQVTVARRTWTVILK